MWTTPAARNTPAAKEFPHPRTRSRCGASRPSNGSAAPAAPAMRITRSRASFTPNKKLFSSFSRAAWDADRAGYDSGDSVHSHTTSRRHSEMPEVGIVRPGRCGEGFRNQIAAQRRPRRSIGRRASESSSRRNPCSRSLQMGFIASLGCFPCRTLHDITLDLRALDSPNARRRGGLADAAAPEQRAGSVKGRKRRKEESCLPHRHQSPSMSAPMIRPSSRSALCGVGCRPEGRGPLYHRRCRRGDRHARPLYGPMQRNRMRRAEGASRIGPTSKRVAPAALEADRS